MRKAPPTSRISAVPWLTRGYPTEVAGRQGTPDGGCQDGRVRPGAGTRRHSTVPGAATIWNASAMPSLPPTFADQVIAQPARAQFEAFIDEHRRALNHCLDGLTEEQARRSLVPSRTTLLGLVKHATFVERVWFDEAITCRPRVELGLPAASEDSFLLDDGDTIASVQQAHREACDAARRATSSLDLDDVLRGNRRGPLPLRWVYLHVLRELAQHCGHADILREQILDE